jgi:hypothetical protein
MVTAIAMPVKMGRRMYPFYWMADSQLKPTQAENLIFLQLRRAITA